MALPYNYTDTNYGVPAEQWQQPPQPRPTQTPQPPPPHAPEQQQQQQQPQSEQTQHPPRQTPPGGSEQASRAQDSAGPQDVPRPQDGQARPPPVQSGLSKPPHNGRYPVRPQQPQHAPARNHRYSTDFYNEFANRSAHRPRGPPGPLPHPPQAQPAQQVQASPRSAQRSPQRPSRSDVPVPSTPSSSRPRFDPQAAASTPRAQPYNPPPNRQPGSSLPAQPHHGPGHWTGDGYSMPTRPLRPRPAAPPGPSSTRPPLQDAALLYPQRAASLSQETRRLPLGPPPSARKGPATYYPPISPVRPIQEETDSVKSPSSQTQRQHTSSAGSSSLAQSNIPDYYLEHRASQDPAAGAASASESEDHSAAESSRKSMLEGMEIAGLDTSSEPVLVRQASLGKKGKPVLTTVKSFERNGSSSNGLSRAMSKSSEPVSAISQGPEERHWLWRKRLYASVVAQDSQARLLKAKKQGANSGNATASSPDVSPPETVVPADGTGRPSPDSGLLSSGTGLLDASSASEADGELSRAQSSDEQPQQQQHQHQHQQQPITAASSEPVPPLPAHASVVTPRVEQILGGLARGGALSPHEAAELKKPLAGLAEQRAGKQRHRAPPRLDMDSVREAEARGSLTSLSDLIKRATRLASNLDSGKTASRLGLDWVTAATAAEQEREKQARPAAAAVTKKRSGGSLSDMLASFPSPVVRGDGTNSRGAAAAAGAAEGRRSWVGSARASFTRRHRRSRLLASESGSLDGGRGAKRPSCCGMSVRTFVLLAVLLILLVATAIVVPIVLIVVPRHRHHGSRSVVSTCQSQLTCANGGVALASGPGGECECLCASGYDGPLCAAMASGCANLSLSDGRGAAVGDAVPALVAASTRNYSLPLDASDLYGLFAAANLSCNTENALVSFNGRSKRQAQISVRSARHRHAGLTGREAVVASPTITGASAALTLLSTLVYQHSAGATTTAAAVPSASSTPVIDNSHDALEFARVAVLFVLQTSRQLETAIAAQQSFQDYFTNGPRVSNNFTSAANVTLGGGFSADLYGHCLRLPNGTQVGGR